MSVLILFGCYAVFTLILVGFKHFGISFKERIGKHYFSLLLSFLLAAVLLLFYYFATDDSFIYSVANIICQLCAISLIVYVVSNIFNLIRKKAKSNSGSFLISILGDKFYIATTVVLSLLIVYIFASPSFQQLINYHHLQREPIGGTYAYYVIAKNEKNQEYTLPAAVSISYETDTDLRYNPNTFNDEEITTQSDTFIINRIYFKNGGYLYFEEPLIFSKPNETIYATDQNNKDWKIKLTDSHTKSEFVKEHNPISKLDYIFHICIAVLAILQWCLWYKALISQTKNIK